MTKREEDYRADWDAGESKKEKAEEKASTKEGQKAAEWRRAVAEELMTIAVELEAAELPPPPEA
jgi:hypothetical protein